jgi:competence protein ComEA
MNNLKRVSVLCLAVVVMMAFMPVGGWAEETAKEAAHETAKININKASAEELTQLKGVGSTYAEHIVEYREAHGPFNKPEDIMKVPGIGPKTWEENKDRIAIE